MDRGSRVAREDLERIRSDLSGELNQKNPRQRKQYMEAASEVYNGLAKMVKVRATTRKTVS